MMKSELYQQLKWKYAHQNKPIMLMIKKMDKHWHNSLQSLVIL